MAVAMMLAVFIILLSLGMKTWKQLHVEEAATVLAKSSARIAQTTGYAITNPIFNNTATASVQWLEESVFVRVQMNDQSATAERLYPREQL